VDHGNDYNNISRTKLGIILVFLCAIPLFALNAYITGLNNGEILSLKNKFKTVHLERNCDWSIENNYNKCFKKDFLQFVRKRTYYEGLLAFDLFLEINKHDFLKQTTKVGKLYSQLDYLESLLSFFEVNRSKTVNRDKADLIGLTIAYFRRSTALDEFKNSEKLLKRIEKEHLGFIETKPILKNRIKILNNRYVQIKDELVD